MLIMTNAIPTGRNIILTTLRITKMIPLIAKSIPAVLNDFELSNGLLLIVSVFIYIGCHNKFNSENNNCQYLKINGKI